MRLIKANSTNLRSIKGKGIRYETTQEVIVDSTKSVKLPVGTTAQRPQTPENGMMRYNTTNNQFEFYLQNEWQNVGSKNPTSIVQQNLGNGDDSEVNFGPLNSGDLDFPVPEAAASILVYVENVPQIATTNYTLVQNPAGKDPGFYIAFGTPPPLGKPVTVLHNFDK
jgi:hypothetical protein